jgi:polyvinyl alcohol dehydrogenase (cytochrome)
LWKVDAVTGQVIWSRQVSQLAGVAGAVSRTSPVVSGNTVYIATQSGARLLAIDTATGNLRWSTQIDPHPRAVITGSAIIHNGVIYEGVSSDEFSLASNTSYDCCTFRGSLVAVDAATGQMKWKSHTLPDQGIGGNIYSGASVWGSTPTIDPASNSIFIGTGQNYSTPQSAEQCQTNGGTPQQCLAPFNAKDSIIAMDLTTGAIKWATGPARFDQWNFACLPGAPPNNCPNPGPDHDTGDGTHLYTIPGPNGQSRRAVGAGQKSGEFWMLDAATSAIIWSASVGPGSTQGGIQWGTATDGQRIFFTESNNARLTQRLPNGQSINFSSFGALDVATGQVLWQVPEPRGAQSLGPVTTANGVVYVGSMNNFMYALNALTGQVLWEFRGAGSSNAGPAIVGGKLYWGNGYQRGGTASTTFYSFSLPSGPTATPTSSPSPTTTPTIRPTMTATPTIAPTTTTTTTTPATACNATYRIVNEWSDGFQAEVTVRAGASALNGWSVRWAFANGQAITQLWNGNATTNGANVVVTNAPYNASVPPNGTTTFGFLGRRSAINTAPTVITCSSP